MHLGRTECKLISHDLVKTKKCASITPISLPPTVEILGLNTSLRGEFGRRLTLGKVPVGEGTVHDLCVESAAPSPAGGEEVREGPPGDRHCGCAGVG